MNPGIVAAAIVLVLGAVVAVSAREGRLAVLGLAVVLVAAPVVADPLPPITSLAIRLTGAVLAAYLIRAALRAGSATTLGTHLGWPVVVLQAAAAAVIGFGIALDAAFGLEGAAAPDGVPVLAGALPDFVLPIGVAAGAAVLVLSIEPIAAARDGLRLGIGLLLALSSMTVIRGALLGPAGGLEHIVVAATIAAIAAGTAVVCLGAAASGGGLSLSRLPASIRARRPAATDGRPEAPDADPDGPA